MSCDKCGARIAVPKNYTVDVVERYLLETSPFKSIFGQQCKKCQQRPDYWCLNCNLVCSQLDLVTKKGRRGEKVGLSIKGMMLYGYVNGDLHCPDCKAQVTDNDRLKECDYCGKLVRYGTEEVCEKNEGEQHAFL